MTDEPRAAPQVARSAATFEAWRATARPLLATGVEPARIVWNGGFGAAQTLPADDAPPLRDAGVGSAANATAPASVPEDAAPRSAPRDAASRGSAPGGSVPRISASLLRLLESIACFRHAGRWELMYRLAWRSMHGNARLLEDAADADVRNATLMDKAVHRDIHKMHAFVRFREIVDAHGGRRYFAWFEPEHEILRPGSDFFVKRFPNMQWTLATPDGAAVWEPEAQPGSGGALKFIESPAAGDRPASDACEDLWRTYYRSICNVARLNPEAMQREMPQRYWHNLPEAKDIGVLLRDGVQNLVKSQVETGSKEKSMAKAVQRAVPSTGEGPHNCRRCDLWERATQAVTGEGAAGAKILLVGEQPGDEEDLRGHPFVGPAGKVLDLALAAAGVARDAVFITNAVKHFKWEPRGRRRLHKKPGVGEINACNIWLQQEIEAVSPSVIVALGTTALRSLTGATWSIDAARHSELRHAGGAPILATYHPSAILRAEGERVVELRTHLENDLRRAADMVADRT